MAVPHACSDLDVIHQTLLLRRYSATEPVLVPLTSAASDAISLARQTSQSLGLSVTRSSHLLLGLLAQHSGLAAQVLHCRGITLDQLAPHVLGLSDRPSGYFDEHEYQNCFSASAQQGLSNAFDLMLEWGQPKVDTEHILLGILRQGRRSRGEAIQLLNALGVNCTFLENQLYVHLRTQTKLSRHADYSGGDRLTREITARLTMWLVDWVDIHLGLILSPGTVLRLTDGSWHRPNIAFISRSNLQRSSDQATIPDFVVEVKSSYQPLLTPHRHLQDWLNRGCRAALLINPEEETVTVYRPGQNLTVLTNPDRLTLPDLLPGWEIPVSAIWSSYLESSSI